MINNYKFFSIVFLVMLLLVNIFYFDIMAYFLVDNFNSLGWNLDYLRHHASSRNILEYGEIKGIFDTSLSEGSYLYVWPIPNYIYAFIISIFGDTLGFLFSIFLFSIFSFYTLYLLLNRIFEKSLARYLSVIFFILGNGVIFYFLKGVSVLDAINVLHRVVNPLFAYPILFLFLLFFIKSLEEGKIQDYLISGFLYGCLFISYIYFATYATVFVALISIYYLKKIDLKIIYFVVLSIPGIFLFLSNYLYLPELGELFIQWKARNGVMHTHDIITRPTDWIHLFLILPAIVFYILAIKFSKNTQESKKSTLIFIFFISAYFVSFSNVITGMSPQKSNWTAYLNFPFFVLLFWRFLIVYLEHKQIELRKVERLFLAILIVLSLFNLNYTYKYVHNAQNPKLINGLQISLIEDEKKLYEWLNTQMKDNETKLLANEVISRRIVAFTNQDTLFLDSLSKALNSQIEERLDLLEKVLDNNSSIDVDSLIEGLDKYNVGLIIYKNTLNPKIRCLNSMQFGELKVCIRK